MKAIFYTLLVVGAVMLPTSKGVRDAAVTILKSVASGVERMLIRGDYAEVRMVDADDYHSVVQEPGRVVIVVIHNELTASSRSETQELDEAIKRLPAKVLVAKVIAERNEELLKELDVKTVPTLIIYHQGVMSKHYHGNIDTQQFVSTVNSYIENPSLKVEREAYIGPMEKDWMPEGVQKKPAEQSDAPMTELE